jgi:hypothetical protein
VKKKETGIAETFSSGRPSLQGMMNGKDEMNLAEFPLAVLTDRPSPHLKTLVFEDRIRDKGRQDQEITRRLTISASDRYGLPTATDDEVILGLVQLSKANDFRSPTVPFSRYELISLLGWRDEGKSYRRVEESLKRWLGVTLYYENAWWNMQDGKWVDAHFHLLETVILQRGRERLPTKQKPAAKPRSSFTWNTMVFQSFQAGYLKQLDMAIYRSLKLPTAKRMFRFLDKKFHFAKLLRFDLGHFAHEHIGLGRSYDAAQLKRRLKPAIKELEDIGYLKPLSAENRFARVMQGAWEIVFVRGTKSNQQKNESSPPVGLEKDLIERGVTPSTAARLVRDYPSEKIETKLKVFDELAACRDKRISINPAGYLVQSICKDFSTPKRLAAYVLDNLISKSLGNVPAETQAAEGKKPPESEKFYVEHERIQKLLGELSAEGLAELEQEALKSTSSFHAKNYRRALESGNENLIGQYRRCLLENHLKKHFRKNTLIPSQKA